MKRTILASVAGMILLGGCTSYYKVTDPTTGRVFYTSELQHKDSGAAQLKDARTGSKVSLQNSMVETITKEQFETGKHTAPEATPAPSKSGM
jgi:hypothetical protein